MTVNLLVSTWWLAEHHNDDNLVIVDIRGHVLPASEPAPHYFSHKSDYDLEHIPNAVFVDWTSDIVEPNSPSYDIANPERYAELMSRLGISNESTVVVYDDANGMFAARFWWTMTYYGHSNVAVLDGGWQKWVKEGHPTNNDAPIIQASDFVVNINDNLHATRSEIEQGNPSLIDVRSPAEFSGTASRAQRKGHIPNAVNAPRKTLLNDDGTLKSANDLQEMFAKLNLYGKNDDIVVYCNSGVSASYGLLALKVAGIDSGRVYDSSWKEWGNASDTAIE
ncbi:MAG: sulfurtransferase [Phototrophicaceae bacterium]